MDPYHTFVSEIMLQQTRAETVIPYYHAFLEAFPTVQALADADEQDVLKKWEGLGYYSRARNLQKAAQAVARDFGGRFPPDAAALQTLPGIGAYTAGAIASIAFGRVEPAIDGNQVRVLTRLFDIRGLTTGAAVKAEIRARALALIDRDRPGDFNQALMGMGALICLPKKPRCEDCPAQQDCMAHAAGVEASLPMLPEKIKQRVEHRAVALVFASDRVLVIRRADAGLLAGLWEFPNFLDARTDAAVREALAELGITVKHHAAGEKAKHVFTHIIWQMTGHVYDAGVSDPNGGARFVTAAELEALAMPTAMRVYREAAMARLEGQA